MYNKNSLDDKKYVKNYKFEENSAIYLTNKNMNYIFIEN